MCLCPCLRVAAKTLLSNLLKIFSQSQWQAVHLPTMTYRACIFVLTDLSKTKLVELYQNAWDENYHSQNSHVFCWMAPWKLLPPNLHPPHFPQQITPFPRHFQRHHWHPLTLLPSPPSLSGARTCGRSHRSRHPSDDLGRARFGRSPGGDFG